MSREDDWNDLRERLTRARDQLAEMAECVDETPAGEHHRRRLKAKAAGVAIALDYMRGYA